MSTTVKETGPLITAVIPTYRRPHLLRRAIGSVLAQEGVPLRVSVYDNASGDETGAMVAALAADDSRLCYHCHAKNIGGAANFNYGLRQVDTPFFSILSDDDYLLPGFYQRALASLSLHSEAAFWAGMVLNVDTCGVIWDARVEHWPRQGLFEPPEGFVLMTRGMAPNWAGIVFRRTVLDLEGLPDQETHGPLDLEYCLRLAARFPYIVEKYASAVFTLNEMSFSATQPISAFWPGWKRMISKFEADKRLSNDFRKCAVERLRDDAKRMLFRRGAHAIANSRFDFARDAAVALDTDCGLKSRALVLRTIAATCEQSTVMGCAYARAYHMAERQIIRSRGVLQGKYGSLLKNVDSNLHGDLR